MEKKKEEKKTSTGKIMQQKLKSGKKTTKKTKRKVKKKKKNKLKQSCHTSHNTKLKGTWEESYFAGTCESSEMHI